MSIQLSVNAQRLFSSRTVLPGIPLWARPFPQVCVVPAWKWGAPSMPGCLALRAEKSLPSAAGSRQPCRWPQCQSHVLFCSGGGSSFGGAQDAEPCWEDISRAGSSLRPLLGCSVKGDESSRKGWVGMIPISTSVEGLPRDGLLLLSELSESGGASAPPPLLLGVQ